MDAPMEILLRCSLRDRPGTLAALAGAIGRAGGDIQAIEVVEHAGEEALDDLVIAVAPSEAKTVLAAISDLDGVRLIHTGPSRGDPADAVDRLALGIEALVSGAMDPDRGLTTLVGGALQAGSSALVPHEEAPRPGPATLVLPVDHRSLVVARDYDFTDVEQARARTVLRACVAAAGLARPASA